MDAVVVSAGEGHTECLRLLLQQEEREVVDCIDEWDRYSPATVTLDWGFPLYSWQFIVTS